jgi:hypothetical protein
MEEEQERDMEQIKCPLTGSIDSKNGRNFFARNREKKVTK